LKFNCTVNTAESAPKSCICQGKLGALSVGHSPLQTLLLVERGDLSQNVLPTWLGHPSVVHPAILDLATPPATTHYACGPSRSSYQCGLIGSVNHNGSVRPPQPGSGQLEDDRRRPRIPKIFLLRMLHGVMCSSPCVYVC